MANLNLNYDISTLNQNNIDQEIEKSFNSLSNIDITLQNIQQQLQRFEDEDLAGSVVQKYQEDQRYVERMLENIERTSLINRQRKRKMGNDIERDFPNVEDSEIYYGNTYFHLS